MAKIIAQISTHEAIKDGDQIHIYTKGVDIPKGYKYLNGLVEFHGFHLMGEFLYSIPAENEDDVFAIMERYEEDNRRNMAELNA